MMPALNLTNPTDDILESREASEAFINRAAKALDAALTERGADFTAIKEEWPVTGSPYLVAQLGLSFNGDTWRATVSDSLAMNFDDLVRRPVPSLVGLSDSELKTIIDPWADVIFRQAKHLCFADMYCPRGVLYGGRYNDLRVAFRIIRAWDPVRSYNIVRFDCVFKNLAA